MTQSNEQQLNNPALLEKIEDKAQEYINHGQTWEAKLLADKIESRVMSLPELAIKNPTTYNSYLQIILRLKLASFSVYDDVTCLNLIKTNFLDASKFGLDFNKLMNIKMYSIPVLVWPEFAQQCIGALKSNSQRIGQKPLEIKGEESPKAPIIQNWLSDYDRTYNIDKQTELQRSQYLAQSLNARNLNEQERNWLLQLLRFYDNLKPLPAAMLEEKPKEAKTPMPSAMPTPSVQPLPPSSFIKPVDQSGPVKPPKTFSPPTYPAQGQPKIEGNIVDLKNHSDNQ